MIDLLAVLLILLTAPLFFYKLGASSLVSFDEAWYASISRNILNSGDFLNMTWNGNPYFDHPPAGFWFQTLSFKFLGISEFSARMPSAVFALIALVAVYFLGKHLFNRMVGVLSALALSSSIWFTFRARSADLDIFLTAFFVLSFYLALKAAKNKHCLLPFSISLAFLFLTKTGIPVVILPVIALIFIFRRGSLKLTDFILPSIVFTFLAGSWFWVNYESQSNFLNRYFQIGFPKEPSTSTHWQNFLLIKEYLHLGMGRWFWPGVLGVIGGSLIFPKRFWMLTVFCLTFFTPFIFSTKGHIWHIIPLHPFLILSFFGFVDLFITKFPLPFKIKHVKRQWLSWAIMILFAGWVGFNQTKLIWYQFIDVPAYVSDEAILSREASKYPYRLIIDDNYWPSAYFYSGKVVTKYSAGNLRPLFDKDAEPILLITSLNRLNASEVTPDLYRVIKTDRDKILLTNVVD